MGAEGEPMRAVLVIGAGARRGRRLFFAVRQLLEDRGIRLVGEHLVDTPDEAAERPAVRRVREELGAGVLRPLWVCAGRLEEQKGQDVLLDALAEVRRRGLEFVAVLAGDGSLRPALEQRARTLGLEANVRFAGQVEDLGPLLGAADVVALPSRWEGMPLVLLEALARGRPVVASAVGGVPEVVTDGEHARLVPPGDVAALATALETFHRHPDEALRMGLLNAVYETQEAMTAGELAIAAEIAANAAPAVAGAKHILNYMQDHSVRDGLNYVAAWNSAFLSVEEIQKALTAMLEKKKP